MKKVLCFGDSNTYGYNPESGARYPSSIRWTGVLAELLGSGYKVIEAGANNRTCFTDSIDGTESTGYKILPKFLDSGLSSIIFAIGINDVQKFYRPTKEDIENGIEMFIDKAKSICPQSKIILASPSSMTEDILKGGFSVLFDKISVEKSELIRLIYEKTAKRKNCIFADLSKIATVSPLDGLHYSPDGHKKIAQYFFEIL